MGKKKKRKNLVTLYTIKEFALPFMIIIGLIIYYIKEV